MTHLVELCAGTAAVSLWALGAVQPLTGYMGSKRKDAALLCTLLGARNPDHVTLVDAGPWGDVWTTLRERDGRRGTASALRDLHARGTLPEVWPSLLSPPPARPVPTCGAVPMPAISLGRVHPDLVERGARSVGVAQRQPDGDSTPARGHRRVETGEAGRATLRGVHAG